MQLGRRLLGALSVSATLIVLQSGLVSAAAKPAQRPSIQVVSMPASVQKAVSRAEDDNSVAVAVLDTATDAYYGSKRATQLFPSESLVKILIAAKLLATDKMTGATETRAYRMITQSDDSVADDLWGAVDGPNVIGWASSYFGVPQLGVPPTSYGHWGNAKFTAKGLVRLLAAIKASKVVGPWLINAMEHMHPIAADGTHQTFGLPHTVDGAFKQGWGADSDHDTDQEQLNSIGLIEDNRFAVAVLAQHDSSASLRSMVPVINRLAAAVVPNGHVYVPVLPMSKQKVTPTPTPTPTPMPGVTATAGSKAGSSTEATSTKAAPSSNAGSSSQTSATAEDGSTISATATVAPATSEPSTPQPTTSPAATRSTTAQPTASPTVASGAASSGSPPRPVRIAGFSLLAVVVAGAIGLFGHRRRRG